MPRSYTNMGTIGYMPMPISFRYKTLFLMGRPRHEKYDDFWRKHPPMNHVHRAKIFAPFDALAGFDDIIESKKVLYEEKREMSETEKNDPNKKLSLLFSLTYNSKVSRLNKPTATVTYFVPCSDEQSEWYNCSGLYETYTGTVKRVEAGKLMIDDKIIDIEDIVSIDTGNANTRSSYDIAGNRHVLNS